MPTPALAFNAYRSTRHEVDGRLLVHGCYDGLTTGQWAHAHDQVLVPLRGRVHVAADGQALVLGPGEGAWIPAGVAHAASTLGGELEFFALNAPAGWLPSASRLVAIAEGGAWLAARQLVLALAGPEAGRERLLALGVEQLGLYARRAVAQAPAADPLERAIALVLARYAEPLTVTALADELGLSPRQFERRFKALAGQSPRRFLIGVRLAAARERLVAGDESVEAIAEAVGFGDVSHFTRSFREQSGETPTAYRRRRLQSAWTVDMPLTSAATEGLPR